MFVVAIGGGGVFRSIKTTINEKMHFCTMKNED